MRSRRTAIISLMAIFLLGITGTIFAETSHLQTSIGKWDFGASPRMVLRENGNHNLFIAVKNKSTDDSYRSSICPKGMATALVDWEIWHPDAGMVNSGTWRFQDICNGQIKTKNATLNLNPKFNILEVRWNVTTPNGGHSFHKDRRTFRHR